MPQKSHDVLLPENDPNNPMSHPTLTQIKSAIPHRPPMLLVDEIVSQTDQEIVCRKTFHAEEFFFQGHYPDHPLVPGVILCECGAQTAAVLLASLIEKTDGVPVLTRMNDVKFKTMVRPGDVIEMQVKLNEVVSNAYFLTAQIKVAGKLAARLSLACTIAAT
jgi:3-hydroxyacyl-[acyl-carrier-protein] dehydratase